VHLTKYPKAPLLTRGGRKKKTGKTTYIQLRQLERKNVLTACFFLSLVRFWAFLGKGSSKTWGFVFSTFPKASTVKYFFGGGGVNRLLLRW
jgi:hypothetical protein